MWRRSRLWCRMRGGGTVRGIPHCSRFFLISRPRLESDCRLQSLRLRRLLPAPDDRRRRTDGNVTATAAKTERRSRPLCYSPLTLRIRILMGGTSIGLSASAEITDWSSALGPSSSSSSLTTVTVGTLLASSVSSRSRSRT